MEDGKVDHHGTRWNPTEPDGTPRKLTKPHGTPKGGNYQPNPLFRVFQFRPSRFPLPPSRNTQRFGGFETPGIGWWAEYRSEAKGQWAQWTTSGPHRTWRCPPETDGTPTGGHYSPKSAYMSRFLNFWPSRFPSPPRSPNTQRFGGFGTPGIGWRAGYRREEKGHRAQWTAAELGGAPRNHGQWGDRQNGPPRNLAEPHGT